MKSHFGPVFEVLKMLKNDPLELNISGFRRKFKNRLGEVDYIEISYKSHIG